MIKQTRALSLLLISMTLVTSGCGFEPASDNRLSEAWNAQNAPENWGITNATPYSALPTSGSLKKAPWLSTYWPTYQGGIAQRWQNGNLGTRVEDYLYTPPSTQELGAMGASELNQLSPVEKYDLLSGNQNFDLTHVELYRVRATMDDRGRIPTWYGLCHGWAPASYMEDEPQHAVTVTLEDGRDLTLYPDDLKALMISAYANPDVSARFIGSRCESKTFVTGGRHRASASCRDTNPGAFHLALAQYVGIQKKGFVVEIEKSKEVWNQPVAGYAFAYGMKRRIRPAERRRKPLSQRAVFVVNVSTRLDYSIEAEPGSPPGTSYLDSMNLQYTLELDRFNRIVGGEWKSQSHPDFLWIFEDKPQQSSNGLSIERLRELVAKSRQP